MNQHALHALEFDRVLDELREYCLSEELAESLSEGDFFPDRDSLEPFLAQVDALRGLLVRSPDLPPMAFPSIADILIDLSKEGRVLDLERLGALLRYLESARALTQFATRNDALDPPVPEGLDPAFDLRRTLASYVDPTGTLKEREIDELRTIRARILRLENEQRRRAETYLRDAERRDYFASDRPTLKDGRLVLPLVADHKGKVDGVVVDVSASGNTIYVEPPDLLAGNNAVVSERKAYDIEVQRILRSLSSRARATLPSIELLHDWVGQVDKRWCRSRYSVIHDCSAPRVTGNRLELKSARHPLLRPPVIPIDIHVGPDPSMVIITGPNTGGKTVALKTVGLLALMTRFGLPVPAAPGSSVPFYTKVFADIGDEQSIEQSLSTFSGHLRQVRQILEGADEQSLVLMDELAAGTDPAEGAALAMAVLDELRHRRTHSIVTSHHGALKHYGYTHADVENASVHFDVETLRPTYHLLMGVPGSSHALTIAERLGLPEAIIGSARAYLEGGRSDSARLIEELTAEHSHIRAERQALQEAIEAYRRRSESLEKRAEDIEVRERALKKQRLGEFDALLAEKRREIERAVERLRTQSTPAAGTYEEKKADGENEDSREVETEARRLVGEAGELSRSRRRGLESTARREPVPLGPGVVVRIDRGSQSAVVERHAKGESWVVRAGSVRMTLPASRLEVVRAGDAAAPTIPKIDVDVSTTREPARFELDIRGLRVHEALDAVERQVDAALAGGMTRFSIIHGTGGGALQQAVRRYLNDRPEVSDLSYARPEEGGFGKTNVQMRGSSD